MMSICEITWNWKLKLIATARRAIERSRQTPLGEWSYLFLDQFGTRNSSGDEIANVNFHYDDIVNVLQITIDSCINSATDRRGYVLERMCLPNSVK